MNLIYTKNNQTVCLVVPPEAVRGLRYQNGQWLVYVSDPDAMAVSVFRLTQMTLARAIPTILDYNEGCKLQPHHGERFWKWMLREVNLWVELVESGGIPAMFPKLAGGSPDPKLGMKGPEVGR